MPAEFTKCVNDGGKVVTEKMGKNKYRHVCYDKDGNRYEGEVRQKKKKTKAEKQVEESKILLDKLRELQQYYNEHYHN